MPQKRSRAKAAIRRSPVLIDKTALSWVQRQIMTQGWRCPTYMTQGDLHSAAAIIWDKLRVRYPDVTETRHMMGLFKTAFTNHIHDLSKIKRRLENEISQQRLNDDIAFKKAQERIECDFSALLMRIAEFPPHIARLVRALYTEPELLAIPYERTPEGRETMNQRLCRIIGLDPEKYDLRGELTDLLIE